MPRRQSLRPTPGRCSAPAACRPRPRPEPRARRHAERHRARSGLHQERIRVAVIAALELDDLVALGRRARDPDRAHRRFRSRADEAHALHRGHQRHDTLRQPSLEIRRRAKAGAPRRRGGEGLQEPLRRVPVDQRSPRHHVVDVVVAVDVLDSGAAAPRNEERRPADRLEGPDRTVDSAGKDPRSGCEHARRHRTAREFSFRHPLNCNP